MYANFWIKAGCFGHSPSFPLAGKRQELEQLEQLEPSRCPVLGMAERPHAPEYSPGGRDVGEEQSSAFLRLLYCAVFSSIAAFWVP